MVHSSSICPKCSYDANPENARQCIICGHPLNEPFQRSSRLPSRSLISVFLVGLAAIGGGYLIWRSQSGTAPNSASTRSAIQNISVPITLLGDTFSGYSTFRYPTFQKALQEKGISLQYQDEFHQAKRASLLNQGKADLLVTSLDQFLVQKPQGQVIGLIDYTVGADAVVLNSKQYPALNSLLDLAQLVQQMRSRGQQLSITFAKDTPSEYLALVLGTQFEAFKLSEFQERPVLDASESWKLLQDPKQNVAVAILWEPYVTKAQRQGYTVVLSSQDTPQTIIDVIVASDRLVRSQPKTIATFLETYYRHMDASLLDASQLKTQIAKDGNLSAGDATAVMQGIDFFTAVEARDWFKNGTLSQRINATAAVLTLAGRMEQIPREPKKLFTAQFVTKAAENTQALIRLVATDNPKLAEQLAGKHHPGRVPTKTVKTNTQPSSTAPVRDIGNLKVQGNVKFKLESADLTDASKQTLNRLAQAIAEFNTQTVSVRVIGHTSRFGSVEANKRLSQQRAQVVANYLRQRGLKHAIVSEGKGFEQPLPGIDPTDPRNQRTEVRLVRVK